MPRNPALTDRENETTIYGNSPRELLDKYATTHGIRQDDIGWYVLVGPEQLTPSDRHEIDQLTEQYGYYIDYSGPPFNRNTNGTRVKFARFDRPLIRRPYAMPVVHESKKYAGKYFLIFSK